MATWKKVLVSGSSAAVTSLTADTSVTVGSGSIINVVGTDFSTTRLTGSFSGSFQGDGRLLTGVVATFPTTSTSDLASSDKFYVSTAAGSGSITLSALLADIAGNNIIADPVGSAITLKVDPQLGATTALTSVNSAIYNIPAGQAVNYIGFVGTSSFANTASFAVTASYAINAAGGTLRISGSDNTTGSISLASDRLIFSGSSNIVTTVGESDGKIGIKLADNIVINGDLAVNGNGGDLTASITTTATNATIFNTNATAINFGGTGTTTTMQNLTLLGNLSVGGTTTSTTTQNLTVADRFILLGSSSLAGNIDGGIVVQNAFTVTGGKPTGSGYALFLDGTSATGGHAPRWAVTSSISELADEVAQPDEYVVTAKKASGAPPTNPQYGGSPNGYGNIYIDSTGEGTIWIYV
jgi:hypothetical protein